ncbi:hypothetical protein [Streptomyces atroolivaceus]|uniref:hypothetical protein n=1 Tax=Streptomyces atroolivaceus TaxID=66869 RepID=UPI0037A415A5
MFLPFLRGAHRTPRGTRRTRWAAFLLAPLLASAGLVATATPSSAGVLDMTCTTPSSLISSYNPPLTNTVQNVAISVTASFAPCVSLSQPGITSGGFSVTEPTPQPRSCADILSARPTAATITWNTGQTSTISGNATTTIVGALLHSDLTGTVTSGLFAGDTVVLTGTGPSTAITLCTLGLASVPSVYTTDELIITSL